MCSVIRSSAGRREGTLDVGAIVVAVAYESCERILKVARALSQKKQREIEIKQIIKRMSRADPNNTRLSVILR